ncbi:ABC1 kinase family protein [Streptomyces hydrogenans]|uniref:ABC1 kinase family protein n=1 Tax=Streptomyces hydrogenans TaxID=1873719 RepID=UPI003652A4B8
MTSVRTTATLTGAALRIGADLLLCRLVKRRRGGFAARTGRSLRRAAVRCGPAFVKTAQLLSTRVDLLPAAVCAELGTLHDHVPPIPQSKVLPLLDERLGVPTSSVFATFDTRAIGSGSIACVYRAELLNGAQVAVKLRRPGVRRRLERDLRLIQYFTRWAARMPAFKGIPAVDIVGRISAEISAQADFAREAASSVELAANLAGVPDVVIARPVAAGGGKDATSTDSAALGVLPERGVLILEYLPGVGRVKPSELPPEIAARAATTALRAVYSMIFVDGFVHCDLHPGNLYFSSDGAIAMVDAGFVHRMSDQARRTFAEFFFRMGTGNERLCADILLTTVEVPDSTDVDSFRADIASLVRANVGLRSRDFSLLDFAQGLFDIQRRHGLFADPEFVFPLLALLTLETAVKTACPEADFQQEAMPFLVNVLFGRDRVPVAT